MGTRFLIGSVDEIKPKKVVQPPDHQPIAVLDLGGEFVAFDELCPHRAGPLSEGKLEGENLTCPWHSAVFNVRTGIKLSGPGGPKIRTYPVVVEGNQIFIELP